MRSPALSRGCGRRDQAQRAETRRTGTYSATTFSPSAVASHVTKSHAVQRSASFAQLSSFSAPAVKPALIAMSTPAGPSTSSEGQHIQKTAAARSLVQCVGSLPEAIIDQDFKTIRTLGT